MLLCATITIFFWPCCIAYGILVSQPRIESESPAMETLSLNRWTTRDVQAEILTSLCLLLLSFEGGKRLYWSHGTLES